MGKRWIIFPVIPKNTKGIDTSGQQEIVTKKSNILNSKFQIPSCSRMLRFCFHTPSPDSDRDRRVTIRLNSNKKKSQIPIPKNTITKKT